jgi:hypothetical protein
MDVFSTVASGGNPTFEIRTWEDLYNIRENNRADYILMNDLDSNTVGYSEFVTGPGLSHGWVPIPIFFGTLDGQGFTISNLIINANTNHIGLFSQISGASITELALENFNINGHNYVGTLAGYAGHSTISSIQLNSNQVAGREFVGGMVGQGLTLMISNSALSNMTVSGLRGIGNGEGRTGGLVGELLNGTTTILNTVMTHITVIGDWLMGGLVGHVVGGTTTISNTVMTDTTVDGDRDNVGGMIGIINASATITNSTLSAVNITGRANVGGLVGVTNGTVISHAVVDGSLSGDNPRGIVGNSPTTATITNASFTGTRNSQDYGITYP